MESRSQVIQQTIFGTSSNMNFVLEQSFENDDPNTAYPNSLKLTEMTVGWATIDIDPEWSKTQKHKVHIRGGSFNAVADIKKSDVMARRTGLRKIQTMFKGQPVPTIIIQAFCFKNFAHIL